MSEQRVLILSASVGTGHNVAASVLEDAFRAHPDVVVQSQDVLAMTNEAYAKLYSDTYQMVAKRMPWLLGWVYDINDAPFTNEQPLRKLWDMLNAQPVVRFIKEYQPDLCICTHFTPAGIVAQMMATDQLDTSLSVVTTDYDFQGMWLSQTFNRYFVAREESKARLIDLGVEAERVTVSGIPVRPVFGQPVNRAAVLDSYELRHDQPVIVVSAGAVGAGPALDIVMQIMKMRQPVQCVVVCGTNERLLREVEAATLPRAAMFRVLGYTDDMPNLVRVATLFVGKPGGLTTSECMATGTPMAIVMPIPGQEERNADYLLEEGAAVRCNDLATIAFKLDRLLADQERLERMRANARRIGRPDAAQIIAATALSDWREPVSFNWREHRAVAGPKGPAQILQRPQRGGPSVVALYDDQRGVYLGALSDDQFRALRRSWREPDARAGTATLEQAQVALLRQLGADAELCAALETRIARYGPLRVRRAKLPAAGEE
jgi:processive 1,2-diacylglycerol beta-glucosyltransferase